MNYINKYVTGLLLLLISMCSYAQNYPGGINTGQVKGWRAEAYWGHTINNNPALFGQGTANATGELWGFTDYINGNEFTAIRADNFSIEYTATLNITTAGVYQFRLANVDDFAWLYIDGALVANAQWQGSPGASNSGYQSINLSAGEHAIKVKFSEGSGNQDLAINWQGNGIPADTRLDARYVYVKDVPMSHWLNLEGAVTTTVSGSQRIQRITNKAANGTNQDMMYLPTDAGGGGWTGLFENENINFNAVSRHNGDDVFRIYNGANTLGKRYTNGLALRGTPYTQVMSASHFQNITGANWLIGYGYGCGVNEARGFYKNATQILHGVAGNATPNTPITYKTNEPYVASGWSEYTAAAQSNFHVALNTASSQGVLNNVATANLTTSLWGLHTLICNGNANNLSFQEYIYYPFQLDATQLKKANTYMAIKWGTNFSQNWIAPNNAVVWDKEGATNTGYQNRVFGIAKDASNGNLNQKQSQSQVRTAEGVFDNTYLTLSKGAIATSNTANTGSIPDGSYVLVGDNAASLSNQTTEIPATFTGCTFGRIGREWKARVTGTPGAITVRAGSTNAGSATFPGNAAGIQLMVDEDKDGNFTTGTIRTYNYTSLANGIATFDNVMLNDGEVFTFVYKTVAPGGVASGLTIWLDANRQVYSDAGTTLQTTTGSNNVQTWRNLAINTNIVDFQHGTLKPNFTANATNYNHGITFNGSDDRLEIAGGATQSGWWRQNGEFSVFSVTNNFSSSVIFGHSTNNSTTGKVEINNVGTIVGGDANRAHNNAITTPKLLSLGFRTGTANGYRNFYNGVSQYSGTLTMNSTATGWLAVGRAAFVDCCTGNGTFNEIIAYNTDKTFSANENLRINSYLGLKYALPIGNGLGTSASNYASSNSNVYWTGDATYKWNMFGIGRDDCSGLDQRQSKSAFYDTKTNLRIGLGTINETAGNTGNTTGFTNDYSFIMLGATTDNTDFTAPLSVGLPTAYTSCNPKMWKTAWKVDRTNNTQNVQLKVGQEKTNFKITKAMTNPQLAVDTDGDGNFTNATIIDYTELKNGVATFNLTAAQLPDNAIITLVWTDGNPGGQGGTRPYVWLDATDIPLDESTVTPNGYSWDDISGNQRHASTVNQVIFNATRNFNRNYNPVMTLDNSADDYIRLPNGFDDFTAGFHNFMAVRTRNGGSWDRYFELNSGGIYTNDMIFGRDNTSNNIGFKVVMGVGAGSPEYNGSATNVITPNVTNLLELSIDAGAVNTTQITKLFSDSKPLALSANVRIPNIVARNSSLLGESDYGSNSFLDYNEVLFYNQKLSDAERLKVQSYMAVQWGFTLDQSIIAQDYLMSDGTPSWRHSIANQGAGLNFNVDMTAIGRDDCSSLLQRQSNSVDGNDIMRFGLVKLEELNENNQNKFTADKSYLFVAHNGANFGGNTTNMPTALNSATACYEKLNRVWQVQKVGTGVSVPLAFSIGKSGQKTFRPNQEVKLLVSTSPTDFTGATIYDATSVLGGLANFEGVNLNHQNYIAIAYVNVAPGGVKNGLVRWYTAEVGTYTDNEYFFPTENENDAIQVWTDNSSFAADVFQTTLANRPKYKKSVANFNPSLEFDGVNDNLINDIYTGLPIGASVRTVGLLATTYNNPAPINTWPNAFSYGGGGAGRMFSITQNSNTLDSRLDNITGGVILSNGFAPANSSRLVYAKLFGATNSSMNSNLGVDANLVGGVVYNTSATDFAIGFFRSANTYYWKGSIGEIFIFDRILTANEDLRIGTTHAIKYGTTLNILTNPSFATKAYLDANSNEVYNYTTYWNRITGIARDYCSGLDQRQSMNTEAGALVAISSDASGGIATSNLDNPIKLEPSATAATYLIFGDDNKSLSWTGERTVAKNDKTLATLARTFRANETGTVGAVHVQVSDAGGVSYNPNQAFLPAHTGPVFLIVANAATNGNFLSATGVTIKAMDYIDATKSWQTAFDFTAGDYFTFASEVECIGPAGILGNLQLWLKANDGTGQTTQGAAVTTWSDASPSANNGTGVNNPAFQATGTGVMNYNPSVSFNGTNQYFNLPSGFNDFTAGASSFVVRKRNGTNTSNGRFFHLSTGGNANAFVLNRSLATENLRQETFNASSTVLGTSFVSTNTPLSVVNPNIMGFTLQGGTSGQTGRAFKYFYNGSLNSSTATAALPTTINRTVNRLGAGGSATEFMNGFIPEVILYNTQLTDLQTQKVNTYLALKYGVTSGTNYISPVFDGTSNSATETLYDVSTFGNRVFGVGIDKTGCLVQNQSKNQEGGLIAISVDGVINTLNAADDTKWTNDRNYIVMGDNNLDIASFVKAGTPGNESVPAIYSGCIINRVNRSWKAQVKGEKAPSVFISIPANTSAETVKLPALPSVGALQSYETQKVYLVINENADFTVDANMQEVELTLNGTNYEATIAVNPNELSNNTFYYTIVTRVNPCRENCIKTNKNVGSSYLK